jgi:hypothetical protein
MKYTLILFLVLNGLLAGAQTYKNPPRNEVNKDSSLKVFVDTLKNIVHRKDAPALLKQLSPAVKVASNGATNGIKGFKEIYAPQFPASQLWKNLQDVIALGGVFKGNTTDAFIFPYAVQRDMKNKYCDGCGRCITIIAPDVHVRKKDDRLAPSVGQLNYEIVKIVEEPVSKSKGGSSDNWVYIQTFDGKITGWVRNDLTWDICDYRLILEKIKGKWRINAFLAGD